jgi:hypothetical protein
MLRRLTLASSYVSRYAVPPPSYHILRLSSAQDETDETDETLFENEEDDLFKRLRWEFIPSDILKRAASFPISPKPLDSDKIGLRILCFYLPSSAERVLELRNIYYSHAAWM